MVEGEEVQEVRGVEIQLVVGEEELPPPALHRMLACLVMVALPQLPRPWREGGLVADNLLMGIVLNMGGLVEAVQVMG
jgi:hypothetical protein